MSELLAEALEMVLSGDPDPRVSQGRMAAALIAAIAAVNCVIAGAEPQALREELAGYAREHFGGTKSERVGVGNGQAEAAKLPTPDNVWDQLLEQAIKVGTLFKVDHQRVTFGGSPELVRAFHTAIFKVQHFRDG